MRRPALISLLVLAACASREPVADPAPLEVIAFGSCARQNKDQPIWDTILENEPDLFLFIGDNVYADLVSVPTSADQIVDAYKGLARKASWQRFVAACPVLATWDDHDYGKNDAGVEWELKRESQKIFLDFFGEHPDCPRRTREGIYAARLIGPPGRRVQVILLDTRYHRDPLTRRERTEGSRGGPYEAGEGNVLGEEQWRWLGEQLRVEADLRIVCTSIQFVAEEHHWEGWSNFPAERARLVRLIDSTDASGVVFVSGDRHLIELSCYRDADAPYPLWDFTSSGLNERTTSVDEPNRHRVGEVLRTTNFGLLHVDWERGTLTLEGRGEQNAVLMSQTVQLADLRK